MDLFTLSIATPEGPVYQGEALAVTIPTGSGELTILPGHQSLVSLLSSGELIIKKSDNTVFLAVSRGVVEVKADHNVTILTDFAERAEQIDIEAAEKARARAEEALSQKETLNQEQFALLQASLERELARLRVGTKHRK